MPAIKGNTQNLTNGESMTLLEEWSVRGFSVLNLISSSGNATINGGTTMGGYASEANEIIPGGSRSWAAPNNGVLVGMIITAPASGTLQVQFLL